MSHWLKPQGHSTSLGHSCCGNQNAVFMWLLTPFRLQLPPVKVFVVDVAQVEEPILWIASPWRYAVPRASQIKNDQYSSIHKDKHGGHSSIRGNGMHLFIQPITVAKPLWNGCISSLFVSHSSVSPFTAVLASASVHAFSWRLQRWYAKEACMC